MKEFQDIKKVYCIGLGGVGVSAVAKLLLARDISVSGSEPFDTAMIKSVVQAGAVHHIDESIEHITSDIDLIVTTDDRPKDHPQLLAAKKLGIPIENFSVTLGRLMTSSPQRLCVAGTNGKSTTSAVTGLLAADAGLDPTVFVGSIVSEFDSNVRLGDNNVFIIEADEYRDHYLNYSPTVITLNNIEPDHLDYFGTKEKMIESFTHFVQRLPEDGMLVANADDAEVMKIAESALRVITFGIDHEADLRAVDIIQTAGQQTWTTMWNGESLGEFSLPLPGKFNIMNTLAAMAGALALGADPSSFVDTIKAFHGVWRRFEILNPESSTTIISDYAHHPTAVQATLEGAKKFYPGRRIIGVFQPHHQSRLTALFDDFTMCFSDADEVMIVETYTVPGRNIPEAEVKTAEQLVTVLQQKKISAVYAKSPNDAEQQLRTMIQPNDVVIIMGAGDIWKNAEQLAHDYV